MVVVMSRRIAVELYRELVDAAPRVGSATTTSTGASRS